MHWKILFIVGRTVSFLESWRVAKRKNKIKFTAGGIGEERSLSGKIWIVAIIQLTLMIKSVCAQTGEALLMRCCRLGPRFQAEKTRNMACLKFQSF